MIKQIVQTPEKRNAQNIFRYDKILGANIKTSPRGVMGTSSLFYEWAIELEHFHCDNTLVPVLSRVSRPYNGQLQINGYLHLPSDLPVMVNRLGYCGWRDARTLMVGDSLWTDSGWLLVDSLGTYDRLCTVEEIHTDLYETYYINGVLAHNKKVSYAN
jgi:hypothetical protein